MKTFDLTKDCYSRCMTASYKIDGVKGIKTSEGWFSRAGKPLYNLPDMPNGEYEIFLGDFKSSISAVKTHNGKSIDVHNIYRLDIPVMDKRLLIGDINYSEIPKLFIKAIEEGYEGLVIYVVENFKLVPYKLKKECTYDVEVIDVIEGTNKNKGKLGAFLVRLGDVAFKVGTGFTDKEREEFFDKKYVGYTIEVSGMEILPSGKIRHPRFVRLREDLTR